MSIGHIAHQLLYTEQPQRFFLGQLGIGGQDYPAAVVLWETPTVLFLGQLGIGGHKYPAAAVSRVVAIARNLCATQLADYIPPSRVPALPLLGQWLDDFSHLNFAKMLLDMLQNKKPTLYGLWKSSSLMLLANDRLYSKK